MVIQISERTGVDRALRHGQQIIEYAVLIAALSTALSVMYIYIKRGLQANIKTTVDAEIGPQRDSVLVLETGQSQTSTSNMSTLANDTMRTQKSGDQGARYDFNSAESSKGAGDVVDNNIK